VIARISLPRAIHLNSCPMLDSVNVMNTITLQLLILLEIEILFAL
jgi:hypothetical protein